MSLRTRLLAVVVGVLVPMAACERIIDIDLPEARRRLVVEGGVELLKGATGPTQQVIVLSTTDAVFNNRLPPPAAGAQVIVTDGGGQPVSFPESSTPGTYRAMMAPVIGGVYTLSVVYDGERYESTDTLRAVAPIDSLYFEFEAANLFVEEEGFRPTIDFTDPPGRPNFYLWEQYFDGVFQILPDVGNQFSLVGRDDVIDGQTITGFQPAGPPIEPGQLVTIRQLGISNEAYDYLFSVYQQTANGEGSPFSVPPADIRGNVANVTDPAHHPLGYFFTVEVAAISRTLPADTVP